MSESARSAMNNARLEAQRWKHDHIGTEHILSGLLKVRDGAAAEVLDRLEVDREKAGRLLEETVRPGITKASDRGIPFTPRAKSVLEFAWEEASALGHDQVGTGHVLLGLIREGAGLAARVLESLELELGDVRHEIIRVRGVEIVPPMTPEAELWMPIDAPTSVRLIGIEDEALSEDSRNAVQAAVRDLDLARSPGFPADVVIAHAPQSSPERMFEIGLAIGGARIVLLLVHPGEEVARMLADRAELIPLGEGLEQRIAKALQPPEDPGFNPV